MKAILFVFLGGGVGSLLRYAMGLIPMLNKISFPVSTLMSNIISAFMLGVFYQWHEQSDDKIFIRYFLMLGLCGGFSTFSSFSLESIQYVQHGDWQKLVLYITASIILCLLAVYAGIKV